MNHRATYRAFGFALAAAWLTIAIAPRSASADEGASKFFSDRIEPLLESRCISCHGPDEQEGKLRLDSREAALQGGSHGPAIVPGDAKKSLLVRAVLHETEKLAMPPKERLAKSEIEALRRWIDEGAPWPERAKPSTSPGTSDSATVERIGDAWHDPRNPIVRIFGGERLDLWSLQPVTQAPLPEVRNPEWLRNAVDAFILGRIESAGLKPSPEAERRALARRLYFDLTGLPPTYDQLEAFVADERPDAYEQLVDQLLASPRHGEHVARMWLDVVRYSDSNGFDWDEFRPRAWLFRDYVIRSLSADKPFDRFLTEQLAGDELLAGPPKDSAEQDALIATGYLRVGPQDNSASLFNEQSRARAEWMADLTETTASAFLGLTYSCCRCHDHKYDPLSQADHFRLRAFFEPLRYADDLPLDLADEQQAIAEHNAALDGQIAPLKQQRDELREQVKQRLAATNAEGEKEPNDKQIKEAFTGDEKQRDKDLEQQIAELEKTRRKPAVGLLATDGEGDVSPTHLLYQGDHKQPRDPVDPGFVSILDPNPAPLLPAVNPATKGRRLTLARWIASPDNPLTARVLVNRLWQLHFGQGLVGTPNDFGLAGDRPTHPQLLDYLAAELVRSGWSIKHVQRLIVTSATYRQSSSKQSAQDLAASQPETPQPGCSQPAGLLAPQQDEAPPASEAEAPTNPATLDPDNRLFARQNLRRLSAEQLRDALLAASGLLTGKAGGEPIWPELPAEVLQANPAFLDDNAQRTKGWYPSPEAEQTCRSIFLVQKRTVRVPLLETFDLPENQTSCARRNTSIVAPQAFALLNSPLATKAAASAAEELAKRSSLRPGLQPGTKPPGGSASAPRAETHSLITAAFRQILTRDPTPEEIEACEKLLAEHTPAELCRALLNVNEFVMID